MASYKYELHSHTKECDRGSQLSAGELVRLYKDAGYDGIVITDHYIERFYTRWFPADVKGLTHEHTEKFRNEMARQFALHYEMPMTSGSDIHGINRLAKGGIMTDVRIKTPKDLVMVLRSGSYQLIENYDE